MSYVAVIPARGGSKGIPRKNLQEVGGVPLIVRGINSCLGARSIDRVVVSTDDQEIRKISEIAGAEVIMRPADLSDDVIMPDAAVIHAIETLRDHEGYEPDNVLFLQCTSPLTTANDLDLACAQFSAEGADSLVSVTSNHSFLWKRAADGTLSAINHDSRVRIGRQEINEEYRETGAFYLMRVKPFLESGHRFFGRIIGYEMPADRSVDIDEPFDLKMANMMLEGGANC